jgi:mRNA interferase RelE/StbE
MYKVYLLPPAQKDLDNYGGKIFRQIEARIPSLGDDPPPPGSIKLTAEEGYRIRSGEYRIVYRIDDNAKIVYIYRIKHRKNIYKH